MPQQSRARTEGSPTFDPDEFFEAWAKGDLTPPTDHDFRTFIIKSFGLKQSDTYIYRATAEVTLQQAQIYLSYGGQNRLHEWYRDEHGKQKPAPPARDTEVYNSIFLSTTSTSKALTALSSNAKKDSLRFAIATHLLSLYAPPDVERQKIVVPKLKKPHTNPYLDVWAWSNLELEWAGPDPETAETKISHALLPIFYHHFGCVVPSYEALCIISQLAGQRPVIDLGSGNGYWTYMLRRFAAPGSSSKQAPMTVVPVDNGLSEWRTMWIGDTVAMDGIKYLQQNDSGKQAVLLLVYPQVGADFTGKILRAFGGDTVIVAGTQNANGFTAFAKETIAAWMAREMPDFEKTIQIPLPSFAGKDEALFVFQRSQKVPG